MTAFSGVHTSETSETVNLGQLWHMIPLSDAITVSYFTRHAHFDDLWGTLSEATNAKIRTIFLSNVLPATVFFKTVLPVESRRQYKFKHTK